MPLNVGLRVKVAKQHDERDHVADQGVVHPQRELTAGHDSVDSEHQGDRELDLDFQGDD